MEQKGASSVTPTLLASEQTMEPLPWISTDDFNPGYLQRSMHLLPKQGDHEPWTFCNDYYIEKDTLPALDLDEAQLLYCARPETAAVSA
jgi:hypothetical protein